MSNFVGYKPNPLSILVQGAKKILTGGKTKTTGREVIDKFKPGTEFKGTPKYTKEIIKAKSEVQKKFKPINEGIANETRQLRQKLQGMRGERITQSGISKGKDVTPGIYEPKKKTEKKAKGGRVGLKRGTGLIPKRKSNVDKIKKTFGTLSVRAGIDNNPNPTYADKIAGAKMKNKKKKKFV